MDKNTKQENYNKIIPSDYYVTKMGDNGASTL